MSDKVQPKGKTAAKGKTPAAPVASLSGTQAPTSFDAGAAGT